MVAAWWSSAFVISVFADAFQEPPFGCHCWVRLCVQRSPSFSFFAVLDQSAFTVRVTHRSPFEFAFAFVWKPRRSPSTAKTKQRATPGCGTTSFCRLREFPKPATRQYTHTAPILCFNLYNFRLLIQ
ncbi:hypothetical protein S245_032973 [Arachis hypogaea]